MLERKNMKRIRWCASRNWCSLMGSNLMLLRILWIYENSDEPKQKRTHFAFVFVQKDAFTQFHKHFSFWCSPFVFFLFYFVYDFNLKLMLYSVVICYCSYLVDITLVFLIFHVLSLSRSSKDTLEWVHVSVNSN